MITQPSPATLLRVVREELRNTVTPTVTDGRATTALAMIDEVLRITANRCEHESAWMTEEIESIAALAQRLVAMGADRDGAIATGATELAARSTTGDCTDLTERYRQASGVLSLCVDVAVAAGGDARTAVDEALGLRVRNELAMSETSMVLVGRE
jgi:hypothetical protein